MGKHMNWREGLHCIRMGHYHLRQMGWRSPKLPTLPRVRSALAAKQALKERGWDSVTDMLDSILPRIAPAQMLLGDFAVTPGDEGLDSLMICLGPRKMLGFYPKTGEVVTYDTTPGEFSAAWRT